MASNEPPPMPLPRIGPQPTPQEFAEALHALWVWSGLTLTQLKFPTTTSHDYLTGKRPATARYVDTFVFRCLHHGKELGYLPEDFDVPAELDTWRRAWAYTDRQRRGHQAPEDQQDASNPANKSAEDNDSLWSFLPALGSFAATIVGGSYMTVKAADLLANGWSAMRKRRRP
jgi:hypothetical protein